jgi:hypothetical protein
MTQRLPRPRVRSTEKAAVVQVLQGDRLRERVCRQPFERRRKQETENSNARL